MCPTTLLVLLHRTTTRKRGLLQNPHSKMFSEMSFLKIVPSTLYVEEIPPMNLKHSRQPVKIRGEWGCLVFGYNMMSKHPVVCCWCCCREPREGCTHKRGNSRREICNINAPGFRDVILHSDLQLCCFFHVFSFVYGGLDNWSKSTNCWENLSFSSPWFSNMNGFKSGSQAIVWVTEKSCPRA